MKWAEDSRSIAMEKVYPPTLLRNRHPPEEYRKMVAEISQEAVTLAGFRLEERSTKFSIHIEIPMEDALQDMSTGVETACPSEEATALSDRITKARRQRRRTSWTRSEHGKR